MTIDQVEREDPARGGLVVAALPAQGGRIVKLRKVCRILLPSKGLLPMAPGIVAPPDLVAGPVRCLGAGAFGASGTAGVTLNTSLPCLVRAQVRNSAVTIIGVGNPIWLLHAAPPAGIPAARLA